MDLGKRLSKVASLILLAETLADVGCDHGYLSIYLVEKELCRRVIAMDVNKGPLQKARENIQKYGYDEYIETRLSNGLNQLKKDEAEGYVCAGMGGPLALQILWNDRDKVSAMRQIILQPQSELWLVRRTLKQWGFVVEQEEIEYEDGKYYFMMRIRPGADLCMDVPVNEDATLFDDIGGCGATKAGDKATADGNSRMSEEGLKHYAYELFAKELLDNKNALLCEFIRKEEERLFKIFDSLCVQEESDKCRARKETVEKELAIHRWALSQFGVE